MPVAAKLTRIAHPKRVLGSRFGPRVRAEKQKPQVGTLSDLRLLCFLARSEPNSETDLGSGYARSAAASQSVNALTCGFLEASYGVAQNREPKTR